MVKKVFKMFVNSVKRWGDIIKTTALLMLFCFSIYYITIKPSPVFVSDRGVYTLYTQNSSSNAALYTLTKEEYDKLLFVGNLTGESLFLDFFKVGKDYALQTAKKQIINKNAHLVFSESGEWGVCEYYYSNKLSNYVIVRGKKVNIHIAYGKNSLTIGTPLIYGSF